MPRIYRQISRNAEAHIKALAGVVLVGLFLALCVVYPGVMRGVIVVLVLAVAYWILYWTFYTHRR